MDPRPLPPGFISQYDQKSQRYFYVDTNTGASQWHHPFDIKPPFPPPVEQTSSSQYPTQFPSSNPNPNPQGHYPLGFTDPSFFSSSGYSDQRPPSSALPQLSNYPPTTYGRGDQMPESKDSAMNPYATMQQQPSSSYPQPPGPPQPMMQQQPSSSYPQPPGPPQPMMQQQSFNPYSQPPGPPQPMMQQQSSGQYPQPPQPTPFNYPPSYPQSEPGHYGGGMASERPAEAQSYSIQPDHRTGNKPHGEAKSHADMDKLGKVLVGAGAGAVGGLLAGKLIKKQHKKHKGWKGKGWKGWKGKGWKGKGWKGKGWKGKGWKGWK